MSSTASDTQELGVSQRAIALPLVAAGVLWLLLSNRFQLLETRGSDLLLLLGLALFSASLWTLSGLVAGPIRGQAGWSFLWKSAFLALLFGALGPTLNAVLDGGAVRTFTTIVSGTRCRRLACTWELRGVRGLPVAGPTMRVEGWRTLSADPGDSLILVIKPGFFGRAWVASKMIHHADPSQIACTRLTVAAASGDTIRLASLLAEGLSIESEEPGLQCNAPLMVAAKAGQVSAVAFLLGRGANANHATAEGETPLMNAVRAHSLAMVHLLLAHGADPQAVGRPGGLMKSVMGLALEVGDTAIIGTLGRAIPAQAFSRESHR